jgi:hypothetical protein
MILVVMVAGMASGSSASRSRRRPELAVQESPQNSDKIISPGFRFLPGKRWEAIREETRLNTSPPALGTVPPMPALIAPLDNEGMGDIFPVLKVPV